MLQLEAAAAGAAVRRAPAAQHVLGARSQVGVDVVDIRNYVGIPGESLHHRISVDPPPEDHRAEPVEVDWVINERRSEGRPCAVRSVTMGADRLIAPIPLMERRDRRRCGLLGRTARRSAGDASWRGTRLDYRPGDNRHATQLACEHGHRRKVFESRPARIVTRITASSLLLGYNRT